MPLDEILRNSAPAIGGLLVAAFALAATRFGRRRSRSGSRSRSGNSEASTTLALDDELVAKAQAYTGLKEESALVREALKALVEREAARRLARLGGSDPDLVVPPRQRSR